MAQPLAYCLPGVRSRVVVSEGTLYTLTDTEVSAILSHERAHLRARHDLVLEAFTAVHAAFPRIVRSANALSAVQIAGRAAGRRRRGPRDRADRPGAGVGRLRVRPCAVRRAGGRRAQHGDAGAPAVGTGNSLVLSVAAYLAAVAVICVPTVAVAVPWLTELQRLFNL